MRRPGGRGSGSGSGWAGGSGAAFLAAPSGSRASRTIASGGAPSRPASPRGAAPPRAASRRRSARAGGRLAAPRAGRLPRAREAASGCEAALGLGRPLRVAGDPLRAAGGPLRARPAHSGSASQPRSVAQSGGLAQSGPTWTASSAVSSGSASSGGSASIGVGVPRRVGRELVGIGQVRRPGPAVVGRVGGSDVVVLGGGGEQAGQGDVVGVGQGLWPGFELKRPHPRGAGVRPARPAGQVDAGRLPVPRRRHRAAGHQCRDTARVGGQVSEAKPAGPRSAQRR